MSVPNQTPYIIYNANGLTTVFPFEFYIINANDIQVTINGTLVSSGYSVSGAGNVGGGDVIFITPPANGSVVMLERVVPTYRLTDYQDNGDLLADTVNKDFDRLWMAIQRSSIYLGLALRRPLFGGPFNAEGYRIEKLADPVNEQDAATKKYVETVSLARTLRVPENTVQPAPPVSARANHLLAFNSEGNPIAVLPASGSASEVLIDLASSEDGKGDALVAVKQPFTGGAARTQHDKNKDVINVKDFGAKGDGSDHPLSEVFPSLASAQAVYPFVTSISQTQDYAAIQAAINAAKTINAAVFIPSGQYIVNSTILADYAISMYGEGGQGLRDVSATNHSPSPVRGTVIMSKVASGRTLSISPAKYCFGLTLRDFAIWGVQGQCDKSLYLNNVGWMGIIDGVNIQQFPNQGLELGYIQDTYFKNCSVLQCGNSTNFAVTCAVDSNYVYFNGCHFELTAYMFNLNNCWNFSWNQCHFEVARPVGDGVTDNDRFYYISTAMNLGSSYRLSFSECTFIPVDAAYLATKLSLERKDVPYFMMSSGPYITFSECIWLAPEGSVDVGYFTGSHIHFGNCQMISATPSKPSLYVQKGTVSGCTFAIKIDDDSGRLFGATVNEGAVSGSSFVFLGVDSGVKRGAGFIIIGSASCNGNEYQESASVHKYLDNATTVNGFDGKVPKYLNVNASGDIDLTDYHPATQLRVGANSVTISHIYGAPYGRDVIVTTNNTGTVLAYSSDNLLTAGAVNYSLGQYHTALFKCVSTGVSVLQQIG